MPRRAHHGASILRDPGDGGLAGRASFEMAGGRSDQAGKPEDWLDEQFPGNCGRHGRAAKPPRRGTEPGHPRDRVTTRPLDKARDNSGNQVNLFLFQMLPNPAWRNTDLRRPTAGAGPGSSPLALNLHYVVSAYGRNDDEAEPTSHRLLGRVMQILHEHPVLTAAEIRDALPGERSVPAGRARPDLAAAILAGRDLQALEYLPDSVPDLGRV